MNKSILVNVCERLWCLLCCWSCLCFQYIFCGSCGREEDFPSPHLNVNEKTHLLTVGGKGIKSEKLKRGNTISRDSKLQVKPIIQLSSEFHLSQKNVTSFREDEGDEDIVQEPVVDDSRNNDEECYALQFQENFVLPETEIIEEMHHDSHGTSKGDLSNSGHEVDSEDSKPKFHENGDEKNDKSPLLDVFKEFVKKALIEELGSLYLKGSETDEDSRESKNSQKEFQEGMKSGSETVESHERSPTIHTHDNENVDQVREEETEGEDDEKSSVNDEQSETDQTQSRQIEADREKEIQKLLQNVIPSTLEILSENSFDNESDQNTNKILGDPGLANLRFKDIEIRSYIGRGVYGACFLCRIPVHSCDGNEVDEHLLVVKFLFDQYDSEENRKRMWSRETPYMEYHKNLLQIVYHDQSLEIDNEKLKSQEICRNLDHPDFGFGISIMKYHFWTLRRYLEARKLTKNPLSPLEVCYVMKGLLEGLKHLNDQNICHRDLHLDNIFLEAEPKYSRVVIGDFGCCINFSIRKGDLSDNMIVGRKDDDWDVLVADSQAYSDICEEDLGGCPEFLAPEIRKFETRDSCLNYSKCDIYAAGKIGMKLLEYTEDSNYSDKEMMRKLELEDLFEMSMTKKSPVKRIDFTNSLEILQEITERIEPPRRTRLGKARTNQASLQNRRPGSSPKERKEPMSVVSSVLQDLRSMYSENIERKKERIRELEKSYWDQREKNRMLSEKIRNDSIRIESLGNEVREAIQKYDRQAEKLRRDNKELENTVFRLKHLQEENEKEFQLELEKTKEKCLNDLEMEKKKWEEKRKLADAKIRRYKIRAHNTIEKVRTETNHNIEEKRRLSEQEIRTLKQQHKKELDIQKLESRKRNAQQMLSISSLAKEKKEAMKLNHRLEREVVELKNHLSKKENLSSTNRKTKTAESLRRYLREQEHEEEAIILRRAIEVSLQKHYGKKEDVGKDESDDDELYQ